MPFSSTSTSKSAEARTAAEPSRLDAFALRLPPAFLRGAAVRLPIVMAAAPSAPAATLPGGGRLARRDDGRACAGSGTGAGVL